MLSQADKLKKRNRRGNLAEIGNLKFHIENTKNLNSKQFGKS